MISQWRDAEGACPDSQPDAVDWERQEVCQALGERGTREDCAESVWIVHLIEGDVAQLAILQVADKIGGIIGRSGCKVKKAVGQRCAVEAKVSFIECWSTEKRSEVCVDWWGVPKRFAECCLPGRGKVN